METRGLQPGYSLARWGSFRWKEVENLQPHMLGPWHYRRFTSKKTKHTLHLRSCPKYPCLKPDVLSLLRLWVGARQHHTIPAFRKLREWICKTTRQRNVKKKKGGGGTFIQNEAAKTNKKIIQRHREFQCCEMTQSKMNNCSIISFQVKFYETVYPKP